MSNLKARFERFMSTLPGVENIDTLMEQCDLPDRKRADYLAFNRRVIIEQKSLETVDLHDKVQAVIDGLSERENLGEGEISLASFAKLIPQSPDGNDCKKRLRQMLTQKIDDVLAKADRQTGDSRKTFVIPQAVGIVVILNDSIQLIEPDFVVDKAFAMLQEKFLPTGKIRYPHNQVVIYISEAHRIQSDDHAEIIPVETIFSESGNQLPIATHCADILKQQWAEFNGATLVESSELIREVKTRDRQRMFRIS